VSHHLSEGLRLALYHTKMVGDIAALPAVVSSAMELALRRSPNDTFHVEVVGELVAEFQMLEEPAPWATEEGSMTCSLGCHLVEPNWPIVWMRLLDSLGWSWLHSGRRMLS
jgi:hypothetical protein